ncbi:hypothetical protein ACDP63_00465 [Paracoccus sp. P2]|uniref:Uncharacterized protein n=1 Tax=Paracoccus pantotrophus TaxID=82367 RepID=A0A7H9BQF6_PARPN|nr:hypothetical protein [Paracoccus pantotrophus]MDF3854102.1 hypothetical protein [Paracoccus pantotrophus]QLH13286.1 hypothetical protein HYQ43_03075 [Paracoccus pantotrophus]SFN94087.1 Hydantoinase/oxoprolinase [Paracoccus pantotrophus]
MRPGPQVVEGLPAARRSPASVPWLTGPAAPAWSAAVPAHITKSNGGIMGIGPAQAEPVRMILSGTDPGVIGAGLLPILLCGWSGLPCLGSPASG